MGCYSRNGNRASRVIWLIILACKCGDMQSSAFCALISTPATTPIAALCLGQCDCDPCRRRLLLLRRSRRGVRWPSSAAGIAFRSDVFRDEDSQGDGARDVARLQWRSTDCIGHTRWCVLR